jgi:hypothetical protein
MNLKVFTVFHRAIDERLVFVPFHPFEIEKYFTFYGVNEAIPEKLIVKRDGRQCQPGPDVPNLILEYQLNWYDGTLQARGFMETSGYVHLLKNRIHESLDYIGVTQYDMRWTDPAASLLCRLAAEPVGKRNTVYGLIYGPILVSPGMFHPLAFSDNYNWTFLLKSYNKFFKRDWDARVLDNKPLTLCQSYLLPKQQFADLAEWLAVLCQEVYPWANQPPYQTHWGVLGGFTERAESLFIAARLEEGQIAVDLLPLDHDPQIVRQLGIQKEQYGDRPMQS